MIEVRAIKLLKNFIYNISYQILTLILPLITAPYLSRVLGVEGIGEYSFTYANTQYFVLFGMLGITMYGSKCIAQSNLDSKKVEKTFWQIYFLQFIFCLISYLLFIATLGIKSSLYFAHSFLVLAALFDISWLYIGIENFKKVVIRNTLIKVIGILLIFILVKNSEDLVLYAYILSLSMLIGQISMWIDFGKSIKFVKPNRDDIIKHLKPTLLLFLPQIASSVYVLLDRTMLGVMNTSADVGVYDQGQKIIRLAVTLIGAISSVMMPRIANMMVTSDEKTMKKVIEKSALFISVISFGLTFGIVGVAKNFVPWFFGEGFQEVTTVFYYSAWIIIAIGGANLFAIQYLIPTNQQNKYTISVCIAAVVNIVLNFILLPRYSYIGASIATVAAEFTGVFIQMYFVKNQLNMKEILSKIPYIFICALIMYIVINAIGCLLPNTILTTFIQVLVGGIIYIVLLFVSKTIKITDIKLSV